MQPGRGPAGRAAIFPLAARTRPASPSISAPAKGVSMRPPADEFAGLSLLGRKRSA